MDKNEITIIDYGLCNLFSVNSALEKIGAKVCISSDPDQIAKSKRIILPGVGAFGKAMEKIRALNLIEPIVEARTKGTPLLGICLGMQLFATSGLEFGEHKGLGLLPGIVKPISSLFPTSQSLILPHISWQPLNLPKQAKSEFISTFEGKQFYFVHSYFFDVELNSSQIATCTFENLEITAVVQHDNVIGCQFHPERSGKEGLALLEKFLKKYS